VVAAEAEEEEEEEEDKVVDLAHLVFKLSAIIVGQTVAVLMQEQIVLPKFVVTKARLHLKIRWVDPL